MSDVLRAEGLSKVFDLGEVRLRRRRNGIRAVEEVSLSLHLGDRLAIVGESGCGKSTLGRLLVGLTAPTSGRVVFKDVDLQTLSPARLRPIRRQLQMVFQDASGSLNPRLRVGALLAEALKFRREGYSAALVDELLLRVGLEASMASRFPHQLSGGQRQRVAIARAIACDPLLLVADEAVAGLDASLKRQVLKLLSDLTQEREMVLVFITHDLAMVPILALRMAVMYCGRLVELTSADVAPDLAQHPYTRALFAAVPRLLPGRKRPSLPQGEPPGALHSPSGCAFHPRCPLAQTRCLNERPNLREVAPGRLVACHFPGQAPSR